MANNLRDCFPMIQSREEVLKRIDGEKSLRETYHSWKEEERKEFLDMCTGARGVKMLYDGFFKEVMNPEYASKRLGDFLSVVLGATVRVKKVLPNDTTQLTDERLLTCPGHCCRVRGWSDCQCRGPKSRISISGGEERLLFSGPSSASVQTAPR